MMLVLVRLMMPESQKRRQDTATFYRLNGAVYIVDIETFKSDKFFYHKGSFAYIMPQNRSIDIDTEIDFELAELLMNKRLNVN